MPKPEIYISTDIESNGPIPGPNSMLSFGSVALKESGEVIDAFEANLYELEGSSGDPITMKWWATQPEAWKICRENQEDPTEAMKRYHHWLINLKGGSPVFVGYPATFDFMFVYWYLIKFVGNSPFSFSALDIKTFAMATLKTSFRGTTKKNMPSRWFDKNIKHTHRALDDAMEQGMFFIKILKELKSQ